MPQLPNLKRAAQPKQGDTPVVRKLLCERVWGEAQPLQRGQSREWLQSVERKADVIAGGNTYGFNMAMMAEKQRDD
jgi:hypothetical protein